MPIKNLLKITFVLLTLVMLDIVQSKHGTFESAWKFTGEDAKLKDKLISISTQK